MAACCSIGRSQHRIKVIIRSKPIAAPGETVGGTGRFEAGEACNLTLQSPSRNAMNVLKMTFDNPHNRY
jgi:hypothetical protein